VLGWLCEDKDIRGDTWVNIGYEWPTRYAETWTFIAEFRVDTHSWDLRVTTVYSTALCPYLTRRPTIRKARYRQSIRDLSMLLVVLVGQGDDVFWVRLERFCESLGRRSRRREF
jgi:hypothetical protein